MNTMAKLCIRLISCSVFCLTFLLVGRIFCAPIPGADPPRILIINSYNYGYDWSDEELLALRQGLLSVYPRAELLVEYLDTKTFHQKRHFPYQAELLEYKYAGVDLDLVITLDNSALDFALGYRPLLFPNIPLVFCGVNHFRPAMLAGQAQVTGVAEHHDLVGTLTQALRLQPDTREVVVVHDFTDTGLAMRNELAEARDRFQEVSLRFMPEAPLETTLEELQGLPRDSLVLILSYTVEKGGRTFSQAETAQLISTASPVPVYAVHAEQLGHGVVGGMLASGKLQGERAAELALRVLQGESAEKIPVVETDLSRPMFDTQVMARFNLPPELLPADATLINLPETFYTVNKRAFWSLLGTLTFLMVLLIVVFRNYLKRKRAEEALRIERNNVQAIFDGVNDAIFLHDFETGRILDVNARTEALYGFERAEIRSLSILDLSANEPPYTHQEAVAWLDRARQGETPMFEWRARHRDGHLFWVEVTMRQAVLTDRKAILVSVRDIEERIRAEEERTLLEDQLHHSEKMQAVGQLAGGIAHDFNNQMAGVLGYAEMLLRRLEDEKLSSYAQKIKLLVQRSSELTRQLLDFSRKGKQLSVPVPVNGVIDEVVSLLERSIDKRIQIRQLLKAGNAATIGDPTQLQNALLNLAINARDAMPGGGELTFETDVVTLGEEFRKYHLYQISPGDYLRVRVSDTGYGMTRETQQHIFEPFFTTKEVGQGTGLGLASVYGTVLSHGGHIDVYSEPGQGTTFQIYLPLAESIAGEKGELTDRALSNGSARILVVDDEEAVREVLAEMLEELGYEVTLCDNGREAVHYYQQSWQEVDLVIVDMVMPELDGRDTYIGLREINPKVRTLLSSGFSINGKAQSILDDGVIDFIRKPFALAELSDKVSQALRVDI